MSFIHYFLLGLLSLTLILAETTQATSNQSSILCQEALGSARDGSDEPAEKLRVQGSLDQMRSQGIVNYQTDLRDNYRDRTVREFVNTLSPGNAKLRGDFLASFKPLTGDTYDDNQNYLGDAFKTASYYVFRGQVDYQNDQVPMDSVFDRYVQDRGSPTGEATISSSTIYLFRGIKAALKRLYQSFSEQGPERQALVEVVKKQDEDETDRATRFLAMNGSSVIAHAQILVSESVNEPLHLETQWGSQVPPIPGKKRGEVGRLFIFSPDEINTKLTIQLKHWENLHDEGPLVRLEFIRRLFAWANQDAGLDSLSFQVNSGVLLVLKRLGIDTELAKHHKVSKTFEGKEVTEHIIVFEKDGMRQMEDRLMKRSLILQMQKFLLKQPADAKKMILRFSHNELRSIFASGLFGLQSDSLTAELANGSNVALQINQPNFTKILSVDLRDSSITTSGLYRMHVMSPHQNDYPYSYKGPFPPVSTLTDHRVDLSAGILHWATTAERPSSSSFLEVHLTREAAAQALQILKPK